MSEKNGTHNYDSCVLNQRQSAFSHLFFLCCNIIIHTLPVTNIFNNEVSKYDANAFLANANNYDINNNLTDFYQCNFSFAAYFVHNMHILCIHKNELWDIIGTFISSYPEQL